MAHPEHIAREHRQRDHHQPESRPEASSEIKLAPNGYYALGKNFAPSVLVTPQEEQNPRVKEILTRLSVEIAGEGRTASVMTGDAASFTWGVGLAHGGSLEAWVNDWFASTPAAKDALLDLGITHWYDLEDRRHRSQDGEDR